ncbi:ANTAR domain-containing protein [Streptomyces flavofungini]|uniref:ANTAR domain-containing protein n=1 Tax=Streptomyces flavofungini TaxID=68200 RepID=UPI0025AFE31F|nr:ANTAR domain-containing protein [Streptomyces flavofungini]WJV50524.1 ANTAR domain-containing protein [Streptomyces flavofungini]
MPTDAGHLGHGSNKDEATAEQVVELRDEVQHLKHAVASHETVDQAIGVVLALGQLSPAEAWDVLREVSMQTNVKLRTVAERIVEWGRTGSLDDALRAELERQLDMRKRERATKDRSQVGE